MFSVILQYDRRNADATSSFRGAGIIEPTQERDWPCKNRESEHGTISYLKADRYRRRQRGPVMDVHLPTGLRGRRVS